MNEDSDTIYGYPRMDSVCKGGNSHMLNFASAYAKGCELEEETRILKKEIDELKQENARLENLTASGIHTCHSECQRPMCVLRRERDKLTAELMKVTAERDGYRSDIGRYTWNLAGCDTIASGWGTPGDYNKEMALPALDSVSRMALKQAWIEKHPTKK